MQLFDNPSRSVFVSEIVGPRQLRNAISLNASIFHLGALIGPALSGIAIVAVGSGWSIAANAVAAAIGAVLIATIRQKDLLLAHRARRRRRGRSARPLRYVLAKPALFWTFVMVGFVSMFGLPLPTLLAGMADTRLRDRRAGLRALQLAARGRRAHRCAALDPPHRACGCARSCSGAMLYGVLQLLVGLAPFYPLFLGLLVTVGLSRLLYATAAETMVQLSSNLRIRGRVMSFFILMLVGGQAIGGPIMGLIAETFGPRAAIVVSGAVPFIAASVVALAARAHRARCGSGSRRGCADRGSRSRRGPPAPTSSRAPRAQAE